MCGRVIQSSSPKLLGLGIVGGLADHDTLRSNVPPRFNAAPGQDLWVIRRHPTTGEHSLDLLRWGLIPSWCKDRPAPPPINARAEMVAARPMFRHAYAKRRCIVPVDGFFEWGPGQGARTRQPYAVAMKEGTPFGLGAIWENWRDPASGEWIRTFAVITTPANGLIAAIHERMPLILDPSDYGQWLGDEPDPRDLLRPFPVEPMTLWPVSLRVNSVKNDDPHLAEPLTSGSAAGKGPDEGFP